LGVASSDRDRPAGILWAVALKRADGLTRLWPSVVGLTAMIASAGLLTLTLRVLPVGTAYVAWVGIGAVGVALAGILAFGEDRCPARASKPPEPGVFVSSARAHAGRCQTL
jgi:quaternary ammonium compound-resistance protein SugE